MHFYALKKNPTTTTATRDGKMKKPIFYIEWEEAQRSKKKAVLLCENQPVKMSKENVAEVEDDVVCVYVIYTLKWNEAMA